MKSALSVLSLSLFLAACGPSSNPVVVNPPPTPSPNQKLILSLDAVLIACEAVAPNTSPVVYAWIIPGCPNAVETVITSLDAGSTAAQVQVAVTGVQTFIGAAPKSGLSTQDTQIIQSILGATQAFLVIYQQQAVASIAGPFAESFADPQKVTLTKAEKDKLKEIRKRAEALRKRKK